MLKETKILLAIWCLINAIIGSTIGIIVGLT